MGREEFKVSQFYVGLWWEQKVHTVQGNWVVLFEFPVCNRIGT